MALDYKIIGDRLRAARSKKNMTQEDLAEQMDVSVVYISRVERGNSRINLPRLNQMCNILGVTEGQVLNGVASNSKSYLNSEFGALLKNCPPEKVKLIYEVAKAIVEN